MAGDLKIRDNPTPATYEQMHRALLTGLVTNVGLKALDGDHYNAPRGIPFAIMSGRSDERLARSAAAVLTKPFTYDDLVAALALLGRPRQAA